MNVHDFFSFIGLIFDKLFLAMLGGVSDVKEDKFYWFIIPPEKENTVNEC